MATKPDIVDLLKKVGPSLSTELIAELGRQGVSGASARQKIARAGSELVKLAGLRFPHNARFVYLPDQFGTKEYWAGLERAFRDHGKSYWHAVAGLKARGGIFPLKYFAGVCGSPEARLRQLSPQRVLERLTAIQFLEQHDDEATGEPLVQFKPYYYPHGPIGEMRARLVAENVALHGVKEWCRRIGFGSFDKVRLRGDKDIPVVAGVTWDLTAPSYARPLASAAGGKIKPGFIVCDVNLRGALDEDAVAAFVRKHDLASAPQNVAPIMPFLIADAFTNRAFALARTRGILATTIAQLFGEDIAKALRDLISLLTDAGATASVNPDRIEHLLNSLTRIEGAADNLRGAVFEIILGAAVKEVEGGFLRTGEIWREPGTGKPAEVDVLLDRPDGKGALIIECKSKIPGSRVGMVEVQRWRDDRVPLLFKALRADSRFSSSPLTFEIWTNGPIGSDAIDWLSRYPTTEEYTVAWKDGPALKTYVDKARSPSIRNVLRDHYFKHPLARITAKPAIPQDTPST